MSASADITSKREERDICTRKKIIDVFNKTVSSSNEELRLNLFKSITKVINQSPSIICGCINPKYFEKDCNGEERINLPDNTAIESNSFIFTGWLLSSLNSLQGSHQLYTNNINLQAKIIDILAVKNCEQLRVVITEYLQVALDILDTVFNHHSKQCNNLESFRLMHDVLKCIPSSSKTPIVDLTSENARETVLSNILKVLHTSAKYICLYGSPLAKQNLFILVSEVHRSFPSHLQLRTLSLLLCTQLVERTGLPQLYSLQFLLVDSLVYCCSISALVSEEASVLRDYSSGLAGLLHQVSRSLVELREGVSRKLYSLLLIVVEDADTLGTMQGDLRSSVLNCFIILHSIHDSSDELYSLANLLKKENLLLPEIILEVLPIVLFKELEISLPSDTSRQSDIPNGNKHRMSESDGTEGTIIVSSISKVWRESLENVEQIIKKWRECSNSEDEWTYIVLLKKFLAAISNVSGSLHGKWCQKLSFLTPDIVEQIIDMIKRKLETVTGDKEALQLFQLLHILTWFVSIVEGDAFLFENTMISIDPSKKKPNNVKNKTTFDLGKLKSQIIDMASIPFNINQSGANTFKNKVWIKEVQILRCCLRIICCAFKGFAQDSRSRIVRQVMGQSEPSLLQILAQNLPLLTYNLPDKSELQWNQSIGFFTGHANKKIVSVFAGSLRYLLCVKLKLVKVIIKDSTPPTSPHVFECTSCDMHIFDGTVDDGKVIQPKPIPVTCIKHSVDDASLNKLYSLLKSDDKDICLGMIRSTMALMQHGKFASQHMYAYLHKLFSSHYAVQLSMASKIPHLNHLRLYDDDQGNSESTTLRVVIHRLTTDILTDIESMKSNSTQNGIILFIRQLVQMSTPSNTVYILMFLTKCLTLVDCLLITAEIHLAVPNLADRLGLSPKELFHKNRQIIAKVLVDKTEAINLEATLTHAAEVFKEPLNHGVRRYLDTSEEDLFSFVCMYIRHFLPCVVTRSAVEEKPDLLKALLNCIQVENGKAKETLLIDNFHHILSYLVFFHPVEMVEKALLFVSKVTGKHLVDIRRCTIQNQINELVLGLPCHPEESLTELYCLSLLDSTGLQQSNETADSLDRLLKQQSQVRLTDYKLEDVRQFVSKRFLGVLVYLDTKIVSSQSMKHEECLAVWCLSPILSIVGPEGVSSVARKLLSTLKISQPKCSSSNGWYRCALAWRTFLLTVNTPLLLSLIQEIMVLITPVLLKYPLSLGPVLNKLLSVYPSIGSSFEHLPPLPPVEELSVINALIEQRSRTDTLGLSNEVMLETLTTINEGLKHGSNDVKRHNLERLLHLLYTQQLPTFTIDSDVCDVITSLYTLLLGLCRSSEGNLQELVAKSLGLLGAMDAARLKLVSFEQQEEKQVHLSNSSSGFICDLISELARSFLSATDSNIQLCASFAMQELLRIFEIKEKKEDIKETTSVGNDVWYLLPSHIKQLVQPFYNSKYTMTGANTPRPNIARDIVWSPLYGSNSVHSFRKWLTEWMIQMLNLVEDDRDYEVFSVCKPIFKRDLNTALHLLSPLVMSILLHSPHHHNKIATEILAVMALSHRNMSETSESMMSVDEEKRDNVTYGPRKQMRQLSVETVFNVLDNIKVWIRRRWLEETKTKLRGGFQPSPQLQQMLDFMAVLPSQQLAMTAFKCHAYTRALMHIEEHIKSGGEAALAENLSFMQQVYVSLDESDGVTGICGIRESEPTLNDLIVQYKAQGRIQDAVGCYERLCFLKSSSNETSSRLMVGGKNRKKTSEVLKMDDNDPHIGLLQCYLSLDQPQAVLNITNGLIASNKLEEAKLNEYRIEAAWRLSQWDDMSDMLQLNKTSKDHLPVHSVVPERSSGACRSIDEEMETFHASTSVQASTVAAKFGISWGEGVGQILLCAKNKDFESCSNAIKKLCKQIIPLLSAATMEKGAYQRAYPYLLKLHILSELEDVVLGILKTEQTDHDQQVTSKFQIYPNHTSIDDLIKKWNDRLDIIQTSYTNLEPVLSFRRTLLLFASDSLGNENKSRLEQEVENVWLHSAKVARKAKVLQQGEAAFLAAGNGRAVFLERAKWSWLKGDQAHAIAILKKGIQSHFPNKELYKNDCSVETRSERETCSKAQLLLAQYSEETATLDVSSLMQCYKEACESNKISEDGHFHFAMYLDRIINCRKEKSVEYQYHVVVSLSKALAHGNKHLYQSLPRMLSIWLEIGTIVATNETTNKLPQTHLASFTEKLLAMNKLMGNLCNTLKLFQLMTALPQLISRICHSHPGVFEQISTIISTLLASFPQQTMWQMIAVSKSSYNVRVQRCQEIFEAAKLKRPGLNKYMNDITKLADRFIELANKQVAKNTNNTAISISKLVRSLPRLLNEPSFSSIIIPCQHLMIVQLPALEQTTTDLRIRQSTVPNHNPFPKSEVYISGIEDQAEVMASLQQPKKITLRGSDGKSYIFMCKPKDDLRKDDRLMDFTRFLNRLLLRSPDARARNLNIRTYGVIPLNEECGLLEWVHNLSGVRNILHKIYREKGIYMPASELKLYMCKQNVPLQTKLEIFQTKLKDRHPPVLGEWFTRTFPHPHSWYNARMSYCRTTAVMSMVGYVLGLGDRHGENINIDSMSGDLVHVDFNCLFNKGESFDWPERVPFRLTHNMVDAMGPTGVEGTFRKSCEITMRIMRDERDALMCVLKPFIHDPLVEWSKRTDPKSNDRAKTTGEINNERAQAHVQDIQHRLKGIIIGKARGFNIPLSVEGQVSCLIDDATSEKLLCQMYIGWAPYL